MSRRARPAPPPTMPPAVLAAIAMSVLALILSATALVLTLSRQATAVVPTPGASHVAAGPTFTSLPTLGAASAGDTAGASPSPSPVHLAAALEALLPRSVNGVALSSQSTTGTAGLGTDPSSTALIASLKGLGKTPADLQIGEAYDESGTYDLSITDFQVLGVDPSTLRQAIIASWLAAGSSGVSTTQHTVGQKAVTTVDYGDGGADDYTYVHGTVVFDVSTSDPDLAAQVLTQLP